LHLTTTSNAIPMLTRLPPKRSFASPIRSQSASLTLGTRAQTLLQTPGKSEILDSKADPALPPREGRFTWRVRSCDDQEHTALR
jgi:hypothetical protein